MASVTSLDKDLRKLRLEKYTPQAAAEALRWIEDILGERMPEPDLLDSLKDGVALCKLVNLAVPRPGVKFKASPMPFVQMENISHFLRACQQPPLNLRQHDMFLTVDLYERKDPAQVLQCLGAFSRVAHQVNPTNFPVTIGPKARAGTLSPQGTGLSAVDSTGGRDRGSSNASNSSAYSRAKSPPVAGGSTNGGWNAPKTTGSTVATSTWSKKQDEGITAPAWNIAQYGYMGGASQGTMGVSFGSRRQITSAGPYVPSLAEKEKKRREKEAEEERQRVQMEEEAERRRLELEAHEEQAKQDEEARWAEETKRMRENERKQADEERRRWEEEERRWKEEDQRRKQEDREVEAKLEEERRRTRSRSDARLQGQFLSQYQAEQSTDSKRIEELERELEHARERERQYEMERQSRNPGAESTVPSAPTVHDPPKSRHRSRSRPRPQKAPEDEWKQSEREQLHQAWIQNQEHETPPAMAPRPLPQPTLPPREPALPPREPALPPREISHNASPRPLPDPAKYSSPPSKSPAPRPLHTRPAASDAVPGLKKAGGLGSMSLLEREMERERLRQQEWEEAQKQTAKAVRSENGVDGIGGGIDGKWDVSQWSGYTGGDSMNRGLQGIGAGRRQIVGPRPPPGK